MDASRNGRPIDEVSLSYGHRVVLRRLERREPLGDLDTDSRMLPLIGAGLVGIEGGTYAITDDGRDYLENQDVRRLKPCPFCGGGANFQRVGWHWRVRCNACCVTRPYAASRAAATVLWNERVSGHVPHTG